MARNDMRLVVSDEPDEEVAIILPGTHTLHVHVGAISEELLEKALETDDVWLEVTFDDLIDSLLSDYNAVFTDGFMSVPANEIRMPDLTPLRDVLQRQVDKINALIGKYPAERFHPEGE